MTLGVELIRLSGGNPIAPFLIVFASVVVTAAMAGLLAGLFAAAVAGGYITYAYFVGFDPPPAVGRHMFLFVGVVLLAVLAVSVGWLRDRAVRLISDLQVAQSQLLAYSESLESQVSERTDDYRRMTARVFQVQERERSSLARELHDELGQSLISLKLMLKSAEQDGSGSPRWADAYAVLDTLVEQTRSLSLALYPAMLDHLSLVGAIRRYAEQQAARAGLVCTFDIALPPRSCSPAFALLLFRCLQEAVTNIVKHARASRFSVALREHERTVELTIEDDGRGFDIPSAWHVSEQGGLGIPGMLERLRQAGGTLHIESADGRGTTVRASVALSGYDDSGEADDGAREARN